RKSGAQENFPSSDLEIVGAHAAIMCSPILVLVNHLDVAIHVGRTALDAGNLLHHGFFVAEGEGLDAAAADANSAARATAGFHPDHVVADVIELLLHLAGTRVAHGHNTDERRHAHDDAEHGQGAAHAVAAQRHHGFTEYGCK